MKIFLSQWIFFKWVHDLPGAVESIVQMHGRDNTEPGYYELLRKNLAAVNLVGIYKIAENLEVYLLVELASHSAGNNHHTAFSSLKGIPNAKLNKINGWSANVAHNSDALSHDKSPRIT